MKHLHVLNNDKFTNPYIKFINKHFDKKKHFFIILGKGKASEIESSDNVFQSEDTLSILFKLILEMYLSKKVHLHGLFFPQLVMFLFLQPWLLKKVNWIVWGGDLYAYRNDKKTIKAKVNEIMRSMVIRNMGDVTTLVKGDYDLAVNWYKTKAKYHHGVYINPIDVNYLNSLPKKSKSDRNNLVNVQVGNSGDPSNNHIEVLKALRKFNKENIKIYLPLSYGGTKEYIDMVVQYGEENFGENFIPLLKFIKADNYAKYLSNIDVAIFNHDRQQGLFNIISLLYLDKKVYIRSDTTSWRYFTSDLNVNIYNSLDLKEISFCEFVTKDTNMNKLKVEKLFKENYIVYIWEKIFEEVK